MNTVLRLGAAMVTVLGGGYGGMIVASKLSIRAAQLEEMHSALTQISFNIGFLRLPAASAVGEAAKTKNGAVGRLFKLAAEDMKSLSPSVAFERALLKSRRDLCLTEEDTRILTDFASSLGKGDTESELNNISAACAKLKVALVGAEADRDRRGRLWRGVGFLLGIFAAIMLL